MKSQVDETGPNAGAEKDVSSIGRWKKLARDKGKAQDKEMACEGPKLGNKSRGCMDDLIKDEGRCKKRYVERIVLMVALFLLMKRR